MLVLRHIHCDFYQPKLTYTRKNKMAYVRLQNSTGAFVSPHTGSVENAVQNVRWTAANGFYETLTDEAGPEAGR